MFSILKWTWKELFKLLAIINTLAFIYLVIEITSGYIEISAGISGYVDSNVSGKVSTDINRY